MSKKITTAKDEFYTIFKEEEILEIINDLENKKEINLKYTYKKKGAEDWDKFYQTMSSPITQIISDLVYNSLSDIKYYLTENDLTINFLDIGPGNGIPVKKLIEHINQDFKINEYVAIDISQEICNITTNNITQCFPSLNVRYDLADLEITRFDKIFANSSILHKSSRNLIVFIGNTISNFNNQEQILLNLKSGISANDFLLFTFTLDQIENRSSLNYQVESNNLNLKKWIPDLIGIDIDKCDVMLDFNETNSCKEMFFILDKDYQINFEIFGKDKSIYLDKNDKINIWKHYLIKTSKIFKNVENIGMEILTYKTDKNSSNAIILCRIKV